ncbi:MAG TPA: hypothetical protein VIE66_09660 [Methylocella sp.]
MALLPLSDARFLEIIVDGIHEQFRGIRIAVIAQRQVESVQRPIGEVAVRIEHRGYEAYSPIKLAVILAVEQDASAIRRLF